MKKYQAIYSRTETKNIVVYCEAENLNQAIEIFDQMVEDCINGDSDAMDAIDYDAMECVDAEDYVHDIEEVKENE